MKMLRCVNCGGHLQRDGQIAKCESCQSDFAIESEIFCLNQSLEGNNQIAETYYNGSMWPKFQIWERLSYLPLGGEKKARHQILKHLPDLAGTKLLDIAIGDGRNMPFLHPQCTVYGVDISRVQLQRCQKDFGDRDMILIQGEAESLPFDDCSFDNVMSCGALNHVSDPAKALREMARVCKPEGIVVVADERPDLSKRQITAKLGLHKIQRWILSRVLCLGEMAELVLENSNLKIEPLADQALLDTQVLSIWGNAGYCIVGKPKKD